MNKRDYSKKKSCKNCKKRITNKSIYCKQCSNKLLPHCFKGGISVIKKYCIICNKKLENYNTLRCKKHANIQKTLEGKIGCHGKSVSYNKIVMKSSWELAYAKFLDKNNIKWQYEPKIFDLGDTTYTPDFYLPETNEYIEIKGYWRDDAKKKFKCNKKLYPLINIAVLKRPELQKQGIL